MTTLERLYEDVLVLRAQAGDRDALAELFRRHEAPVRGFVGALLAAPDGVEDVLQNVWMTVCRKLGGLRQPGALRTWLYRIARHAAFAELRRRRTWQPLPADPVAPDEAADAPDWPVPPDVALAALTRLSPEHREALFLRYLRGLDYAEIATVTGAPLGTIRSRLHYGRAALRDILREKPHG